MSKCEVTGLSSDPDAFDVARWLHALNARGVEVELLPNDRVSIGPRLAVASADLDVLAAHRGEVLDHLRARRRTIDDDSAPIVAVAPTDENPPAEGARIERKARTRKPWRQRQTAPTVENDPRQPLIRVPGGNDVATLGRPRDREYAERPQFTDGRAVVEDDLDRVEADVDHNNAILWE
jgi:hypothetical protein